MRTIDQKEIEQLNPAFTKMKKIRLSAATKILLGRIVTQFLQLFSKWILKKRPDNITVEYIEEFVFETFGKTNGDTILRKLTEPMSKVPTEEQCASAMGISANSFSPNGFYTLRLVIHNLLDDILDNARSNAVAKDRRKGIAGRAVTLMYRDVAEEVKGNAAYKFVKVDMKIVDHDDLFDLIAANDDGPLPRVLGVQGEGAQRRKHAQQGLISEIRQRITR